MGLTKTIVCLANSRKPPSGRCVAGREMISTGFGDWVRPVSSRDTREVSEEERRYEDGTDPAVLDIIQIEMIQAAPQRHQQENLLLDDGYYWQKKGVLQWAALQNAAEDPGDNLWINGYSSSSGQNDRVPEQLLDGLNRSLYLVRPEQLRVIVATEGGDFGPSRRRVRARFLLNGNWYRMVVTDPQFERRCLLRPDGEIDVPNAFLCVSLGESFHGFAYKLVASVITP